MAIQWSISPTGQFCIQNISPSPGIPRNSRTTHGKLICLCELLLYKSTSTCKFPVLLFLFMTFLLWGVCYIVACNAWCPRASGNDWCRWACGKYPLPRLFLNCPFPSPKMKFSIDNGILHKTLICSPKSHLTELDLYFIIILYSVFWVFPCQFCYWVLLIIMVERMLVIYVENVYKLW
jgi:hypothetical protein